MNVNMVCMVVPQEDSKTCLLFFASAISPTSVNAGNGKGVQMVFDAESQPTLVQLDAGQVTATFTECTSLLRRFFLNPEPFYGRELVAPQELKVMPYYDKRTAVETYGTQEKTVVRYVPDFSKAHRSLWVIQVALRDSHMFNIEFPEMTSDLPARFQLFLIQPFGNFLDTRECRSEGNPVLLYPETLLAGKPWGHNYIPSPTTPFLRMHTKRWLIHNVFYTDHTDLGILSVYTPYLYNRADATHIRLVNTLVVDKLLKPWSPGVRIRKEMCELHVYSRGNKIRMFFFNAEFVYKFETHLPDDYVQANQSVYIHEPSLVNKDHRRNATGLHSIELNKSLPLL